MTSLSYLPVLHVGVCCRQKYEGWSISTTDGMSVGVPYLFSDDGSYHELKVGRMEYITKMKKIFQIKLIRC